ncbi:histidine kinase-like ATPase [Mycotypha africana]|uniref:histidine kinase-like ATPase n=1 Tax=Mycotypha africana TaxID=64632 RepID=UPI0022FFE940|nr:histidine kinase-like ATPase [Mycotypha africana]KAI8967091.1 histidine kinase-like ATPase [Mycotypha africana]
MSIHVLDTSTIRNIHSGQVITDVEAIVKELLENSLDAHATSIDVVSIYNGLESIQVKDNGDGIAESDRPFIAKRHHTSKLSTFEDLAHVWTYGFRGEAIHSMLNLSNKLTLTTKTKKDTVGKLYDINKNGDLIK